MNKAISGVMVAGAMTASLVLFGCGGVAQSTAQSTAQSAAQSTQSTQTQSTSQSTQQQTSASTTTETAAPANSTAASTPAPAAQSASQISADEAKQIALTDAGLSAGDVTGLKAELDTDDAVVHYDVDFKSGGNEYDYDIDANNGAILTKSVEVDD